jgi:ribosome-associated protein
MSGVCDYFIIASGASTTQVRAISDHIRDQLREGKEKLWHIEGEREASWLLLDYGDVVAHIFLEPTRRFYDLERLWADASQSRFKEKEPKRQAKKKKKVARKRKLRR